MRFSESEKGEIVFEGDTLHYKENHENNSYHQTVNLGKLEYVYGLVAYNNQAFLFCFDAHQHRIPVEFKGFKKAYKTLSERFGFKDKTFP